MTEFITKDWFDQARTETSEKSMFKIRKTVQKNIFGEFEGKVHNFSHQWSSFGRGGEGGGGEKLLLKYATGSDYYE